MLEWTGERFLPWIKDATIAYEHLHRYAYATRFVENKRVLDLASGEGYGSKMLAGAASFVLGVDLDERAVCHAADRYGAANLQFIQGSITDIPAQDHSFDVIVCFEAIEHIEHQEELLRAVKRVLAPGGLFVVSTPNKLLYREQSEEDNPFHVKELSIEEFQELLRNFFRNITCLGQRIHPHSNIWPLSQDVHGNPIQELVIERGDSEFDFVTSDKRTPVYVIALASDATLPDIGLGSVLVDHSDELIHQKNTSIRELTAVKEALLAGKASSEEALEWLQTRLDDREQAVKSLQAALEWRDGQLRDLEGKITSHEEALAWRAGQVEQLEKRVEHVEQLEKERAVMRADLAEITNSQGWQFILRVCRLRDNMFPDGSRRRQLLNRLLR